MDDYGFMLYNFKKNSIITIYKGSVSLRITIVGNGMVVETLIHDLLDVGHELTVIDSNIDEISKITDLYDVRGIVGDSKNPSTLIRSNINVSDVLIALSDDISSNILTAITAKKLGAEHVLVRIKNIEDNEDIAFLDHEYKLDYLIDENQLVAGDINQLIEFFPISNIEKILSDVYTCEIIIDSSSTLLNKELKSLSFDNVIISSVNRDGTYYIPKGNFIFKEKDKITLTGRLEDIALNLKKYTTYKSSVKNLLIIGGGKNGYLVASYANKHNIHTTILEYDLTRCDELNKLFPSFKIIQADGKNTKTLDSLLEQNKYDVVVAASGSDEVNLVSSLYAKNLKVAKIITELDDVSYRKVLNNFNINSVLSAKSAIISDINHIIRGLDNKTKLFKSSKMLSCEKIYGGACFSIVFEVLPDFKYINIELKDKGLLIKDDAILAAVVRRNKIIIPNGKTILKPMDKVVVISTSSNITKLEDIIKWVIS